LAIGFLLPGQPGLFDKLTNAICLAADEGGRPGVAIGRDDPASPFPQLVFDRQSGLLARAGRTRFEDYREVEGLKIPFAAQSGGPARLQVEQVRFNVPIDPAVFERPDAATAAPSVVSSPRERTLRSGVGRLEIVREPEPARFGRGTLSELPVHDAESSRPWQVDLRGYDLAELDLSNRLPDLLHADFDSATRWPAQLPAGFDRDRILALGKDPGLAIRTLHRRGITGRGIGLGILDQPLLVQHQEYRDRLRLYEEIHIPDGAQAQMHGPAVASIAVGQSVGVAPAADLYYLAEQHGTFTDQGQFDWDFTWLAQSLDRLLEVNRSLPSGRKLRVVSVSVGWSPNQKGYAEAMAAVERATRDGVFVISSALESTHGLRFHGLGREAMADPNDPAAYGPGSWWASVFWSGQRRFGPGERLLVPMDARAVASPTGTDHYVYYSSGGWSWSIPWIAGLYALACEVKPDLDPGLFWATALKTGRTVSVTRKGETLDLGTIADPVALIEALAERR